jgi:hypothetical protein
MLQETTEIQHSGDPGRRIRGLWINLGYTARLCLKGERESIPVTMENFKT